MKKNIPIKIIFIFILIIFPLNVFAFEISDAGTYNVSGGTKTDYLIGLDNTEDNSNKTIHANIAGTYIYQTAAGSLGVISLGNYGINGKNTVIVNGNIKFIRTDSSENDFYGFELFANSNLTLNGDLETSQSGTFSNSNNIYGYGINVEALSNLVLSNNITINKIETVNTNGNTQAVGIMATSKDGTNAASYEGKSTILINDPESLVIIKNINSSSTTKTAISRAIAASGEANNPQESSITIDSKIDIENIRATGLNDNATGILATILGKIDINGDLSLKNVTATTKEAYAVGSTYGGIVNINKNNNKTVAIEGDIWSLNCFNDDNDASIVNINLSNNTSYLKGATIIDDDASDHIYGKINLSLKNGAVWNQYNRTRMDTKSNLSEITNLYLTDSIINMFNDIQDSNQKLNILTSHDLNGEVAINTDVKNTSGTNVTDYINIENNIGSSIISVNAYDKNAATVVGTTYKQWFATTPESGVEFIPGEAIIDGIKYYPIIEFDNKISGTGKLDWYIVGYTKDVQYTLSFDTNGGNTINSISKTPGTEINLDEIPVKDGYTFKGWYEDELLTKPITKVVLKDKNVIVYAKWQENVIPINPNNPFTGDKIIIYVISLIVAIAVIFICLVPALKRKDKKEKDKIAKQNKIRKSNKSKK